MERLAREFDLDIDWKPFELHPEIPPEGITPERLFGGRRRGDDYMGMLREEGEKEGLIIKPPQLIARSLPSLEAAEFAREAGPEPFNRLHHRLFEAYFTNGENIGDPDLLVRIGREGGLGEGLAETLASGAYRERVRASTHTAHSAGISGTPTFIFDERFALVGAQSYDVFRSVTQRILERRAAGYPEN